MSIVYRKDQKEIMKYRSGTMGIQAVPGAGKTFIITHLVSTLLEEMVKNDDDGKILVLTYMNSAVNNFKSRIRKTIEGKEIPQSKFEVMTIHSLAMNIIKDNADLAFVNSDFEVIDDYKKGIILDNSVDRFLSDCGKNPIMSFLDKGKKAEKEDKWNREFKGIMANAIKLLKYENLDDEKLKKLVEKRAEKCSSEKDPIKQVELRGIMNIMSPIYSNYQEELRNNGYMDYDDILLIAYNILAENSDIAEYYQDKYKYVFEDECQDSNLIQGKIIDIISENRNSRRKFNKNLVRVGDINQSITGTFTGSDPENFINFCKNADYKYNMNMASRSSRNIIDLANELVRFVSSNKNRPYYNALEELYIEEVEKGKGYKENPVTSEYGITSMQAKSQKENTNIIIDEIKKIKKSHKDYSIGILSFANYNVDDLAEELEAKGIDFEKMGGNQNERKKLIFDLKAAVDFLIEPDDWDSFMDFIIEAFIIRRGYELEKNDKTHKKVKEARERLIYGMIDEYDAFDELPFSKSSDVINPEDITAIRKYFKKVDIEKWIFDDEYYRDFKNSSIDIETVERQLSDIDILKHKFNMREVREKIKRICSFSQVNPAKLIENISNELDLTVEERRLAAYVIFYIENLTDFENADLERVSIALDRRYSRVFDAAIDSIYDIGEKEPEPGSVTLATLHKSKGMEWDAVIITGMNSMNFPAKYTDYFRSEIKYLKDGYKYPEADVNRDIDYFTGKAMKTKEEYEMKLKRDIIAERVRLLYVGITRAKKRLLMMYSMQEVNKTFGFTSKKYSSEYFNELTKFVRVRV